MFWRLRRVLWGAMGWWCATCELLARPQPVRLSRHFVSPGMSNRLSHPKPAPPPRIAPWKARFCGWVNRRSSGIKLEGLTTLSVISMVTETDTIVATLPQAQIEEEEGKADFSTCNVRRRQRMTRRPMDKLFSTKYRTRLGIWNVRTLYQTGRCAQAAAEMNRYNIEVLGLCEVRWNTFGKVTLSTGQVLLYSGVKREFAESLAQHAEEAASKGDSKTVYDITRRLSGKRRNTDRPIRNCNGAMLTILDDQLKKWRNHFKTVLNRPPPVDPPPVQAAQPLNFNTGPISIHEIKTALKNLKNGKAAGAENIPPEALKAGGQTSVNILHDLINHIWETETIPQEWRKGLLVKLPKKGNIGYCENWRGITLLSTPSKLLSSIILTR